MNASSRIPLFLFGMEFTQTTNPSVIFNISFLLIPQFTYTNIIIKFIILCWNRIPQTLLDDPHHALLKLNLIVCIIIARDNDKESFN